MNDKVISERAKHVLSKIDYTNILEYLVADKDDELLALKDEYYNINTVVICPSQVELLSRFLENKDTRIAAAIAYPSGAYRLDAKKNEIIDILDKNRRVDELYMVGAVGKLLDGNYDLIRSEMKMMTTEAKGRVTKYVIEIGYMDKEQMQAVCNIASDEGIDYMVASTGFTYYDIIIPTEENIGMLKDASRDRVKIVACGNIDTLEKAEAMIGAGADRICTQHADAIANSIFSY